MEPQTSVPQTNMTALLDAAPSIGSNSTSVSEGRITSIFRQEGKAGLGECAYVIQ